VLYKLFRFVPLIKHNTTRFIFDNASEQLILMHANKSKIISVSNSLAVHQKFITIATQSNSNYEAKMMKRELSYFCDNTTLHGFSYTNQGKRHMLEKYQLRFDRLDIAFNYLALFSRIFWLAVIAIAFFFTGQLIHKFFNNVSSNKIAMTVVEKKVRVTDIFFPAVTVCSGLILRTNKETALNYDEIMTLILRRGLFVQNIATDE
jgi:Amiloride-sensitive sodium channel